jgi:hypothetical protein
MAGSLYLNKRFECAVKNLVGEGQWNALRSSKGFQLASSLFEKEIKKGFKGDPDDDCFDDDDEFYVNFYPAKLTDNPDRGLESNTWSMVRYVDERLFFFFFYGWQILTFCQGRFDGYIQSRH